MRRLRYWLWCLRYGNELTFEQWDFLDFMSRVYRKTVGKAVKDMYASWRKGT